MFVVFYFLPAIVAVANNKRNKVAIALVNLFLGWTVIGWIAAMIWAAIADEPALVPMARGYCPYCGAARYAGAFCSWCGRKLAA